ncbi:MAG: hypothetical protein V7749_16805 [Cocleimonas sp.]
MADQSSQSLSNISVIIPVWHQETELQTLLKDLESTDAEIILSEEGSRAKSLNVGAAQATRNILWFVHADSRITPNNIKTLNDSLSKSPDALHYFKLKFAEVGLSSWNSSWANLRSAWFDLPYGDQALCISKQKFELIGAYPEDTPYGEDLLFVRLAKHHNIELIEIPSILVSSARKYKTKGWLKTTFSHWAIMVELLRKKL